MRATTPWSWPSPNGLPSVRVLAGLAALLAVLWLTAPVVEFNLFRLIGASGRMAEFAIKTLEAPDWAYLPQLLKRMLETVEMTVLATAIALVFSLPLGILAAGNSSPHPLVSRLTRDFLSLLRAMPELVWAMVFVSALGLGPLPGVLALAFVTVGFMAKFFADAIEVVGPKAVEGVRAHGAGWLQVRVYAMLPQAFPDFVGTVAFTLDHNLRTATVLGLVGAGGIGYDLLMSMRMFQYGRLLMIMASIYILVTALDRASDALRGRILRGTP